MLPGTSLPKDSKSVSRVTCAVVDLRNEALILDGGDSERLAALSE